MRRVEISPDSSLRRRAPVLGRSGALGINWLGVRVGVTRPLEPLWRGWPLLLRWPTSAPCGVHLALSLYKDKPNFASELCLVR